MAGRGYTDVTPLNARKKKNLKERISDEGTHDEQLFRNCCRAQEKKKTSWILGGREAREGRRRKGRTYKIHRPMSEARNWDGSTQVHDTAQCKTGGCCAEQGGHLQFGGRRERKKACGCSADNGGNDEARAMGR